jgi:ribosomal protein S18 acetylase RimI-like enzyme
VKILKDLYNRAWQPNWGAVAMTDAEFDFLAADLKQVISPFPEFAMIVERKGEPVGFSLTLPDINQVLKANRNGWLIPGAIRLLTSMKKITLARIVVLGVVAEYQNRGIDAVMYYEIWDRAAKRNIRMGEASWVLEDNVMMNRAAELMSGERYKTYRIYECAIQKK